MLASRHTRSWREREKELQDGTLACLAIITNRGGSGAERRAWAADWAPAWWAHGRKEDQNNAASSQIPPSGMVVHVKSPAHALLMMTTGGAVTNAGRGLLNKR
jgi:hypothetical protein